uniref:Tryptophan synthase beta chain-like PALP domain-containing protein n=2 Tax=Panagrolaimus sp. JU765 TaxID=591449 RepID=A0AC34QVZ2_9BILA
MWRRNVLCLKTEKVQTWRFWRSLSTAPTDSPKIFDPNCDPDNPRKLSFTEISSATYNIKDGILRTECRKSHKFSDFLGSEIFLKMECNQVTGSFKERGARYALLKVSEEDKKAGVWAASAGNHALALCYHGKLLGIPINVVMPRHAPLMKIDYCTKLGANIIVQGKDLSAARETAFKLRDEKGGIYINGYDHLDILAGAGTIGLELLDQLVSGMRLLG